jgi:acyl-CoA reductase-like NAD-dependent aldehyde dehydrogenase
MPSTANQSNSATKLDFTTFRNVINGKLVSSSQTRHGLNPANKQPLAEVPIATPQDLDSAVAAARAAFKTWSQTTEPERAAAINAFAAALVEHEDEFARLLTTEQGKPVRASTSVTRDRRPD